MSKTAIIFSGQGSQVCQMGSGFKTNEAYRRVIETIAGVRKDINYLLQTSNQAEIDDTLNAQIALFANQIAIYQTISEQLDLQDVVYAGFSLGEYTAMCAAGVTDIPTMASIIDQRANAMAKENGNGTMKAIIGLEYPEMSEKVTELNEKYQTNIQIANYNQKNQIVLAGTEADFSKIIDELTHGKIRVIDLKVSGAFHTDLFKNCAQSFASQIENVEFKTVDNLYSNVTAKALSTIDGEYLQTHMTTGVNWYPEVQQMIADGVDTFIEINEKSTLLPMIKRIDRKVNLIHVKELADLEKLEEKWQTK